MTPETLDDAAGPLGALTVMCSAHGENTVPLISSLTLNPVGHSWEACSSADRLLRPRDPETVARLVSFQLTGSFIIILEKGIVFCEDMPVRGRLLGFSTDLYATFTSCNSLNSIFFIS